MKKRSFLHTVVCTLIAASPLAGTLAHAQSTFPDRPVRVVVPFGAGNTLDNALRQVAEEFKKNTGQPMLVDNKPGGSGIIAAQIVKQAAPDGYTLLLSNTSMFAVNPHTFSKLPYDPDKDFRSVTSFLGATMVLAVHSGVPVNNLAEFVAWTKANPGKVSYASFTAGNSSHFAGVILNKRAGLDMVHVPFNGTPAAVQNLVGAQVSAAFLPLLAVLPHVQSGKIKVLAASSPKRSALIPAVATFNELGYPEMNIHIWSGISAPAGTPDAIIARLNTEIVKVLKQPDIQERWSAVDFEAMPSTPQEFTRYYQADSRRWAEAVRLSGFKANE